MMAAPRPEHQDDDQPSILVPFQPSQLGYLLGSPLRDAAFYNIDNLESLVQLLDKRLSLYEQLPEGPTADGAAFIRKSIMKYAAHLSGLFRRDEDVLWKSHRELGIISSPSFAGSVVSSEFMMHLFTFGILDQLLDCMRDDGDLITPPRASSYREVQKSLERERVTSDGPKSIEIRQLALNPAKTVKKLLQLLDGFELGWKETLEGRLQELSPDDRGTLRTMVGSLRAERATSFSYQTQRLAGHVCRLAMILRLFLAVSNSF